MHWKIIAATIINKSQHGQLHTWPFLLSDSPYLPPGTIYRWVLLHKNEASVIYDFHLLLNKVTYYQYTQWAMGVMVGVTKQRKGHEGKFTLKGFSCLAFTSLTCKFIPSSSSFIFCCRFLLQKSLFVSKSRLVSKPAAAHFVLALIDCSKDTLTVTSFNVVVELSTIAAVSAA